MFASASPCSLCTLKPHDLHLLQSWVSTGTSLLKYRADESLSNLLLDLCYYTKLLDINLMLGCQCLAGKLLWLGCHFFLKRMFDMVLVWLRISFIATHFMCILPTKWVYWNLGSRHLARQKCTHGCIVNIAFEDKTGLKCQAWYLPTLYLVQINCLSHCSSFSSLFCFWNYIAFSLVACEVVNESLQGHVQIRFDPFEILFTWYEMFVIIDYCRIIIG